MFRVFYMFKFMIKYLCNLIEYGNLKWRIKEMNKQELDVKKGLRSTRVEETKVSSCDPESGLNYYGYPIEYLAYMCEFEEVSYLLQYGKLPNKEELQEYKAKLMDASSLSEDLKNYIKMQPKDFGIQEILNVVLNYMRVKNPEKKNFSNTADITIKTIGTLPSVIAYWKNFSENAKEINLDTKQEGLAGLFLEKFNGKPPTIDEIKALNFLLISYAEHELNASTYTGIVTASAKSDYYSCIIGSLGTFFGPIHGGACEVVMNQLEEFLKQENIEEFICNKLSSHEKIYGFGHGAYGENGDPRTSLIKKLARKLTDENKEFQTIEKIEKIMKKEKPKIPANVDLYSALLIKYLGIKPEYCTSILIMSRICGWSTHIAEKREEGTLIRPRGAYNGTLRSLDELLENIKRRDQSLKINTDDVHELKEVLIKKYERMGNERY